MLLIQIKRVNKRTLEEDYDSNINKEYTNLKKAYYAYIETIFEYLNKELFLNVIKTNKYNLEIALIEMNEKNYTFSYLESIMLSLDNFKTNKNNEQYYDFAYNKGYISKIKDKIRQLSA